VVIELKDNILSKRVHPDLLLADLVYKPARLILENLKIEDESEDYGAAEFTLNNYSIKFRVGKITPTKVGQQKMKTKTDFTVVSFSLVRN
jgi:hypothetical protein